jgi:YVTN family beta-propeller protein
MPERPCFSMRLVGQEHGTPRYCNELLSIISAAESRDVPGAEIWPFLRVLHILSLDLSTSSGQAEAGMSSLLAYTAVGDDKGESARRSWNDLLAVAAEAEPFFTVEAVGADQVVENGNVHEDFWVAIMPDGTRAYVTNVNSNTVSVIGTATNTVVTTIPVGLAPFGVAITPAPQAPKSKEDCKHGGYQKFGPPAGPFKNQGQCVSYVEHWHQEGKECSWTRILTLGETVLPQRSMGSE